MEIERWVAELTRLHERIGGCFVRPEPRQRALRYLHGVLGPAVRKNGWQLAEQMGETTPIGVQRLLREAQWDTEAVTDELQRYIKQQFGAGGGVMAVDETAFRKKGHRSAGVKRQYCSTTGQIENCQVGVFLYYVSASGASAFLDRALYLPEDWIADRERCHAAAIADTVSFQTKPEQARRMLQRAKEAGFRPAWTVGDAVYGSDPGLRAALEAWRWPYVLGIRSTEPVRLAVDGGWSEQPAGAVAAALPATAWRRLSAGAGTKGPRLFDWAAVPLLRRTATTGPHTLLVRRSLTDPNDTALFLVFHTRATTLADMVTAAGWRWSIETGFEAAKGDLGLDQYEVRQWHAWYRHITLVLVAYAFLAVIRAHTAPPPGRGAGLPTDPADPARDPPPALPSGADRRAHPGADPALVSLAALASGGRSSLPFPTTAPSPWQSASVGQCILSSTEDRSPRRLRPYERG